MKTGILLVDKPKGITSHDVVAKARRAFSQKEVGHAGTLDPMAEGLMVVLLGDATKISEYVLSKHKTYRARVEFGKSTNTWDADGEVQEEQAVVLDPLKVKAAAEAQDGEFQWPIPMFSAKKQNGKKLYELAREGKVIELPTKPMKFWDVKVIEVGSDFVECEMTCSKGSFIRTWCVELGKSLGVPSHMARLIRTASAPYDLKQAADIESLANFPLIPMESALSHWVTVSIRGREETLMSHGQIPHDMSRRLIPEQRKAAEMGSPVGIKVINAETGHLVSLLLAEPGRGLRIRKVFNSASK